MGKYDYTMYYTDPALASVITMGEVLKIWGVTRRTVEMAYFRGDIDGRKSVTGGSYLFTRASLVRRFGEPEVDDVQDCYLEKDESS